MVAVPGGSDVSTTVSRGIANEMWNEFTDIGGLSTATVLATPRRDPTSSDSSQPATPSLHKSASKLVSRHSPLHL